MKSWDELTTSYVAHLRAGRRAASTIQATLRYLDNFREFCAPLGVMYPADVTRAQVAAFEQRLRWEPAGNGRLYSQSAVQSQMQLVRRFFRWAVKHGAILVDPFRDTVLSRVTHFEGRRYLTVAEVRQLLNAPPTYTLPGIRDRAILETLYGTGLRRAECMMLDVSDVDLENGTLMVRHGKGGVARRQPLGPTLQAALEDYLKRCRPHLVHRRPDEGALFIHARGTRMAHHSLADLVRKYALQAGLGRVTTHHLRHAFATHLLAGGAELEAVQQLLGHEHLESTSFYTTAAAPEVARTHRKTHPRARRKKRPATTEESAC